MSFCLDVFYFNYVEFQFSVDVNETSKDKSVVMRVYALRDIP